jgi:hypothetical protein
LIRDLGKKDFTHREAVEEKKKKKFSNYVFWVVLEIGLF